MAKFVFDQRLIHDRINAVTTKAAKKAAVRALNRTVTSMRMEAKRQIKARLGVTVPAAQAKGLFTYRKASSSKLRAIFLVAERGVSLSAFKPKAIVVQTSRGKRIGATIQIGGKREIVPRGFLAELKSGKTSVFQRVGDARLPIAQVKSDKIGQLFKDASTRRSMYDFAQKTLLKNFKADFAYYSAKAAAANK